MNQKSISTVMAVCLLLALGGPVFAHGWIFPNPPVTPPPAPGTAAAKALGLAAGPGYTGPNGGATAPYQPGGAVTVPFVGGTPRPVSDPVPEPPTTGPATGGTTAAPRPVNPGPRGRGVGRATPRARSKARSSPWLNRIKVPWQAAFLPLTDHGGYQGQAASISQALKMSPGEGGWVRDDSPSLVLTYDPSVKGGMKALRSLEDDARFLNASHLFNCFRIDSRSLPAGSKGASLSVFRRDGTLVGAVNGDGRLRGGYALLRKSFDEKTGGNLDRSLPHVQQALQAIAQAEYSLQSLGRNAVDPASGKVRSAAVKTMKSIARKLAGWKTALEHLKKAAD